MSNYDMKPVSTGAARKDSVSEQRPLQPLNGNESELPSDFPMQGDDISEKENAGDRFDPSSFGRSDGQGGSRPGGNMNFDPRSGGMAGNPTETSDTTKWILVGGSVLLLAAGLFVATKKKY